MTQEQVHQVWAPDTAQWSPWAKPVLFAQVDAVSRFDPQTMGIEEAINAVRPVTAPLPRGDGARAIVVDLPGLGSIACGLALAERGYRPVPLYNSVPARIPVHPWDTQGIEAAIDMHPIVAALAAYAPRLGLLNLPDNASPAFLLDARRRMGDLDIRLHPGSFDNRSISLPTDFPSANLLLANGITTVLLIQQSATEPQPDLCHTLLRWEQAGIKILATTIDPSRPVHAISIPRPALFRHLWHAMLARLGLRPHPLGGYGGLLPFPSTG